MRKDKVCCQPGDIIRGGGGGGGEKTERQSELLANAVGISLKALLKKR